MPRVGGIIDVRNDRITQDLDHAAKLKGEADAAVAAYEQELAEAKVKANAIGQQAATPPRRKPRPPARRSRQSLTRSSARPRRALLPSRPKP